MRQVMVRLDTLKSGDRFHYREHDCERIVVSCNPSVRLVWNCGGSFVPSVALDNESYRGIGTLGGDLPDRLVYVEVKRRLVKDIPVGEEFKWSGTSYKRIHNNGYNIPDRVVGGNYIPDRVVGGNYTTTALLLKGNHLVLFHDEQTED